MHKALRRFFDVAGADTTAGRELLAEQHRILQAQIPFMYALMFVDACFLSFATYDSTTVIESLGVPTILCLAALVRTIVWLRRKNRNLDAAEIQNRLANTIGLAALLSAGFGGWGLLLFESASQVQRTCIGLYIFMGAISCSYCLQALPGAARLVLLCGAAPMGFRLLQSGDWLLAGLGANLFVVLSLIMRLVGTSYASLVEVLTSRSAMIFEREKARDAEQRAHQLAYHDPLTGLPNRRALSDEIDAITAHPATERAGLLIVDLDRFKTVNDVHGHQAGDKLLRDVSARLRRITTGDAAAYRLGGDEFAILIKRMASADVARGLARRIVQGLSEPFESAGDVSHYIGASVGISVYPDDAADNETLMRRADIALYRAKDAGRGQHRSFEATMDEEIRRRSVIEQELRAAIQAGEVRPFYQPLVELDTGRTVGFELLARWHRHDGVEIGPSAFIPIAEESGLMNDLMLRLVARACEEAAAWDPRLRIAVNISPVQLQDPWLAQKLIAAVTQVGFPPQRLSIEITENALITDSRNALLTVTSLKNQGMRIALDDFGTGYSSLQHLRMLPFDEIKIDRSFVLALDADPDALKIIRAIISLAASLSMPVVAEGIESKEAETRLRELGCRYGQGYFLGRPLHPGQVLSFLAHKVAGEAAPRAGVVVPAQRQVG